MTEITDAEIRGHQEGIAAEHVSKGFYDDDDLALLGMSRDEAREVDLERQVRTARESVYQLDDRPRRRLLTSLIEEVPGARRIDVRMADGVALSGYLLPVQHYHVVAVQDSGGTQEWVRGWDDKWTLEQACQHADDMAEADTAYVGRGEQGMNVDAYEAAADKFGEERFHELISGNVAPGWDAIWVVPCEEPCTWSVNNPLPDEPAYWHAAFAR